MLRPSRIPLFPLDVVLLPSMHLPLHIFEPRYKSMIARCLDEKIEFGMILASNKSIATMGCTAEITRRIRDYPDGRLDIATEGRAVFHLRELLDEKEYYEAIVEYAEDETSVPNAGAQAELEAQFEKCHLLLYGRPWMDAARNQPETLSYHIAGLLPVELEKRQVLLEMRSENARRELLLRWVAEFLPRLADQQRMRQRAGGNGHGLN